MASANLLPRAHQAVAVHGSAMNLQRVSLRLQKLAPLIEPGKLSRRRVRL
jgi:hypothetical protein